MIDSTKWLSISRPCSTKARKVREVSSLVRICGNIGHKVMRGALLLSVSACTISAPPIANDGTAVTPVANDGTAVPPIVNDWMAVHSIVKDIMGKPVKDAVVYAMPKERMAPTKDWETTVIVENNTFQPFVMPVQTGSAISFVNADKVQHHIYSLSPVIKFDLRLDKAASSELIALEKAGVVVLGCAIHDRMVGYLYVMETAWFARTGEDGSADLIDLPRGTYDVLVWHPWMEGSPDEKVKRIAPSSQRISNVDFVLPLRIRNNPKPRHSPSSLEHPGE